MATDSPIQERGEVAIISLPARLEAILYLKGRPVSIKEMAELAQETEEHIEQALMALMAGYAKEHRIATVSFAIH